jgi:hypothetical protein
MNRKDFFIYAGRLVILSTIALLGVFLTRNRKIVTPDNCAVSDLCKNCGKSVQCELYQENMSINNGK